MSAYHNIMVDNIMSLNHRVLLYLDNAAYRIWKSMPRGRRSEAVCKLMKGEEGK